MGHRAAVFPDVADTPMFREKVADIESSADITRESCSKLAKEASKYCEGLDAMAGMHEAFAAALQSFCPSTKQDTDVFGRAKFERFGQMLCSMAEFTRNLHREIIHNMVEPLNSVWVGQLCTDVPREKHSFESSQKAYDGLKHRYLGLKKLTRKEVVKRTEDDLRKAKAKADLARHNMAKKLTEMELMKSYDFLLMLSTCMEAHMTYFQEGRELFESSKEDLISAKDLVYCRRVEMQSEMERLDYLISCEKEKVQLQEEINDGLETAPTGTGNCGGPLQMSAANQKIAEIEAHVQVALRSRGQQRKTLKRGYLLKRSSNMRGAWKERFFKLDSRGLLFYQSKKKNGDPKWYLRLLTASVKDNDDEDLRFCFTVVSPNKALTLQAENEAEKQEWIQVIQTVIHCLLHSSEDPNLFYDDLYVRNHSRGQTHSFSHDDFHLAPSDHSFSHSYTPDPRSASFRGYRGSIITQPTSASYIRASRSLDYFARPSPMDVSDSSDTPFDRVGKSNGNHVCADCGAPDPEWASLNLGVVVCIECSGVHRQLGVQISKMRSLKLDVKVWTEPLLRVFSCLGNETCNKIWEYELQRHEMQLRLNEEWEDTEEEGELYPSSSQIDSSEDFLTDSDGRELEMPMADFKKPTPTSPLNEKEAFIRLKYVERRFLAKAKPRTKIDTMLWNSIFREDIKGAYTALIGGADINSMHATNAAKALVGQLHGKIYGAEEVLSPRFTHYAPVLLLACRSGNLAVLEFMLQNNANLDLVDSCRRGTLHYSVGFNRKEAIKMLLEKGAKKDAPDLNGLTPVDVANKLSLEEGTIELLMPRAD